MNKNAIEVFGSSSGICDMNKLHIKYWMFDNAMALLTAQLLKAKAKKGHKAWTHVVGVQSGGLPAAVHVAKHLGIYLSIYEPSKEVFWLREGNPLIVDDFFDSGKTVDNILCYINNSRLNSNNFAFAFCRLHRESASGFIPRFFGQGVTKNDGHLVFPWEPFEV